MTRSSVNLEIDCNQQSLKILLPLSLFFFFCCSPRIDWCLFLLFFHKLFWRNYLMRGTPYYSITWLWRLLEPWLANKKLNNCTVAPLARCMTYKIGDIIEEVRFKLVLFEVPIDGTHELISITHQLLGHQERSKLKFVSTTQIHSFAHQYSVWKQHQNNHASAFALNVKKMRT